MSFCIAWSVLPTVWVRHWHCHPCLKSAACRWHCPVRKRNRRGTEEGSIPDGGNVPLSGDLESCACAHLVMLSTRLHDGRIFVRMGLSAQVGVPSGSSCLGHTAAFWVTDAHQHPLFSGATELVQTRRPATIRSEAWSASLIDDRSHQDSNAAGPAWPNSLRHAKCAVDGPSRRCPDAVQDAISAVPHPMPHCVALGANAAC
jgi:hypothetical protein